MTLDVQRRTPNRASQGPFQGRSRTLQASKGVPRPPKSFQRLRWASQSLPRATVLTRPYKQLPVAFQDFQSAAKHAPKDFPMPLKGHPGPCRFPRAFQGLPRLSNDFLGAPKAFHGLPRRSNSVQGLSRASRDPFKGFQGRCGSWTRGDG